MVQDHWSVSSEPQFVTTWSYSWTQGHGGGTQPSTAGGDGAPTAMVAVPGLSGALTQAFPLLGGSGTVSMEASLRLRAKDYAAHDRWLVNLQDVITSNRLDDLWVGAPSPPAADG